LRQALLDAFELREHKSVGGRGAQRRLEVVARLGQALRAVRAFAHTQTQNTRKYGLEEVEHSKRGEFRTPGREGFGAPQERLGVARRVVAAQDGTARRDGLFPRAKLHQAHGHVQLDKRTKRPATSPAGHTEQN
jgi:hypothetical protein